MIFDDDGKRPPAANAIVARELLYAAAPQEPPATLRRELLDRIRGTAAGSAAPAGVVERAAGRTFSPTGIPGVDMQTLWTNHQANRQTVLLRLQAGAQFPVHRHSDAGEECYVIEGDVADGTMQLEAGDYVFFPPHTEHGPLTTRAGALLLIVASPHAAAHA